jgi:hypothetical protein
MDETGLRDRLASTAGRLHVDDPPIDSFVRMGRRRARRARVGLVAGAAAVVVVAASLTWSIASLTGLRGSPASQPRKPGQLDRFDVGGRPIRRVAIGGGAAWDILHDHGANGRLVLVRIDDRTREVRRIGGLAEPQYVTAGFGAIWVSACAPRTREDASCPETAVFELDPSTGRSLGSVRTGAGQSVSLVAGEGAVWVVVNVEGGGVLVRVDPRTLTVAATIPLPGCCGLDLAAGEGAVWVQNDRGVVEVDPKSNAVRRLIVVRDSDTLAAGGGFVWVNTGRFSRFAPVFLIDPRTGRAVRSIPGPGFGQPVFADGKLWIASPGEDRRIAIEYATAGASSFSPYPVSPKEGEPKEVTIGPGGPLVILAIGDGAIWTGTDESEQVIRIEVLAGLTN